jgi:hypothetical protein
MEVLTMLWKNRKKSVSVWLTVVGSCLVLAVVWAVLATSETALAKKPVREVLHGSVVFADRDGDKIKSDSSGDYVHDADLTEVGLGSSLFKLTVKSKRDAGRSLEVVVPDGLDPDYYPANENIWILTVIKGISEFRALSLDTPVMCEGYLIFGQTGKDEAGISFGYWPEFGGSKLTVTRTGVDMWTIESLVTDEAVFYRHGKATERVEYGRAPMPFRITYTGQ